MRHKLAVGRMVHGFDAQKLLLQLLGVLIEVLVELLLGFARPCDQPGVDILQLGQDLFEELAVVAHVAAADLVGLVVNLAVRRVRLGLVLAEIGRRAEVEVPQEALQRAVQEQAIREAQMLAMQGQRVTPSDVLKFYQQNPQVVAQIRAPLFEERVVDFILERSKVSETKVSKEDLMKDPEGDN